MFKRFMAATTSTVALVSGMAATTGCDPTTGGVAVQVRDSAGVTVVVNDPGALADTAHWRVGSATLRLGAADRTGPEAFHRVVGAVYQGGEIIVADGGSGEVRWFDTTGHHLATAGGVGEGPGEFRSLAWIGRGSAGELLAWDRRLRRVSVFLDHEFVSTVTPPFPEDRAFPVVHAVLPDGSLVSTPGAVYVPEDEPGVQRPPMAIWILSLSENRLDTLTVVQGQAVNLRPSRDGGWIRTEVPFGPTTLLTTVGENVVIGDNAQYEVQYLTADGGVQRLVRMESQPQGVTREDLAVELERRLESVPPVEEIRAGIRASFEDTPPAESMPAFVRLLGDTQGNLWVLKDQEHGNWDVINRSGRLIASATLPSELAVLDIAEDFLLGVERDELGVEYVVLRQILQEKPLREVPRW